MDDRFIGRQAALSFLGTRLDAACRGESRVVLVEGAAGVGKTALLCEFLARTDGHRLLSATGDELETDLAYGVVEQLLADVDGPLPEALTALRDHRPEPADPVKVGAGIVELLGRLHVAAPIILVLDDAHMADPASLEALAFALRRLKTTRLLTLLSVRDDSRARLPATWHRLLTAATGARLRLDGLGVPELRELSGRVGPGVLSWRAAARLHDHTGGNALHARTLLEEQPLDALLGGTQPLPAPRRLRVRELARLAACPPDTERLVVAAAVLGARCPLAVAARLARLLDPLRALEGAVGARLLEELPASSQRLVGFPHPLVRAAVYHHVGPARRARLHADASRLVKDPEAILRHRVAAASGPDPQLATDLAALAGQQAQKGSWGTAADTLLEAARLSGSRVQRERFVLDAVDQLLVGGSMAEVAALAHEVLASSDRGRRDYALARLAAVQGRHADAERLLVDALGHVQLSVDHDLTAAIREQYALHCLFRARAGRAVAAARRAPTASSPSATASNILDILSIGLAFSGRASEALGLTTGRGPAVAGELDGRVGRGVARWWTDDLAGARSDLGTAVAAYARCNDPLPWSLIARILLAETEYRLGAWDDAVRHAEDAVSLARDSDQDWLGAVVHAVASVPLAGRGLREAAAIHAATASEYLKTAGSEVGTALVATAQAHIALADEDDQGVVAALEPLRRWTTPAGIGEPDWQPWRALYAEALVGLGDCDQAEAMLGPLEAFPANRGRPSVLVAACRARAILETARGHLEAAEAAFQAALRHAARLPVPFERGRLEAAYGRFLGVARRRREGATHLATARAWFAQLDAAPYLERCEHELAVCLGAPAKDRIGPEAPLTPQEMVVARLVAAGQTNRQVAARLVVSVKTIEYHLGNVYAKLGVTSRTQLLLALRGQGRMTGVEQRAQSDGGARL